MKNITELLNNVNKELNTLEIEIGKYNDNGFELSEPIYLCTWNNGERIEFHTQKSLLDSYPDIKSKWETGEGLISSDQSWSEVFMALETDSIVDHQEDNMYIRKIGLGIINKEMFCDDGHGNTLINTEL